MHDAAVSRHHRRQLADAACPAHCPRSPRCCTRTARATPSLNWNSEARLVARGLIAHGVQPGERVVVWATNVPEWIVLQFALAKAGAILVTANTSLRAKEIDYLLRQSEAATIVTISGFRGVDYIAALEEIGATRGRIPGLERLVFVSRGDEITPPGFIDYRALRTGGAACRRRDSGCPQRGRRHRRRDQHAVHVGHDRIPEGRHAVEPQHRQQR